MCPNCNCDFVVEIVERPTVSSVSVQLATETAKSSTVSNAIAVTLPNISEGVEKTESQSSIGELYVNMCYYGFIVYVGFGRGDIVIVCLVIILVVFI